MEVLFRFFPRLTSVTVYWTYAFFPGLTGACWHLVRSGTSHQGSAPRLGRSAGPSKVHHADGARKDSGQIDGELFGVLPARFFLAPNRLRVVGP